MAHLYMFEFMFGIFFILFISVFVYFFYTIIKQNRINNNSPRLKVEAKVVDKRDHHSHSRSNGHTHTYYSYYITFEFESGDRMELAVPEYEYGLIIEGDYGYLTFQGTRFISFERR
jgi:hypothetical protein